ncbi:MAG: zinc ribbon domain-containing protein, partial [Thermohalobaculum sp.]|nr:zinc ribbon domain-containing protein [Thermohalobaculum sp.]
MTEPLQPPPKKNPQLRTPVPHVPPMLRSRAALGLTLAAAEGRFMLQGCAACGALQYPPRDACRECLGTDLTWQDVPAEGELMAETRVQTSPDLYFRARTPWRMGMVRLDAGLSILCHLHGDCATGGRVRLIARLDRAGQGVIMARPPEAGENMEDDPEMRELSAHPKHRRVLITDARAPEAPDLA